MDALKDLELWSSVGKFGSVFISGGLLTAYLQHFFKKKVQKEEQKTVVKYLALRLAFLFEGYAVECADKAGDQQLAYDSEGTAGRFIGQVPVMPPLPLEDNHKFLDHNILNDIYDFPQRCVMANQNAMFWEEVVGDRDSCTNALGINTIKMGVRAINIGNQLRKMYNLSPRLLGYGEFDVENFLKKELEEIRAHEEKNR